MPQRQHCGAQLDTMLHTLVECAAWEPERSQLESVCGPAAYLGSMVEAMLRSKEWWQAIPSFCESVMAQKETAELKR
ncbi:hypothetical protein K1T71_002788 [Dendrolimus kikuchii]|uniref:Uncharacterized protein n=1 Tax=Dendrolimus kikuchii TaxID=765133 RepID=A0ACC1DDX8_9NEOP|nr:hypothetical protein K1T71_002788 [Dendrolimus kikuchii]